MVLLCLLDQLPGHSFRNHHEHCEISARYELPLLQNTKNKKTAKQTAAVFFPERIQQTHDFIFPPAP